MRASDAYLIGWYIQPIFHFLDYLLINNKILFKNHVEIIFSFLVIYITLIIIIKQFKLKQINAWNTKSL